MRLPGRPDANGNPPSDILLPSRCARRFETAIGWSSTMRTLTGRTPGRNRDPLSLLLPRRETQRKVPLLEQSPDLGDARVIAHIDMRDLMVGAADLGCLALPCAP
jgi:hypothetical protein